MGSCQRLLIVKFMDDRLPLAAVAVGLLTAVLFAGGPKALMLQIAVPIVCAWFKAAPATVVNKSTLVSGNSQGSLPVHTLTLALPAGVHLGARVDLGDVLKVVVPGWKPMDYSISAEDPKANTFDITFKVYPGGRTSERYLNKLRVGDSAQVFCMGPFERSAGPVTHVGVIALGVGITEALPIAHAELLRGDTKRVTLLWASRTRDDTFWEDRLEQMAAEHGERFKFVQIFSQEQQEGALRGRINTDVLKHVFLQDWFPDQAYWKGVRFLTVGTEQMKDDVHAMLEVLGYSMPAHSLLKWRSKPSIFLQHARL